MIIFGINLSSSLVIAVGLIGFIVTAIAGGYLQAMGGDLYRITKQRLQPKRPSSSEEIPIQPFYERVSPGGSPLIRVLRGIATVLSFVFALITVLAIITFFNIGNLSHFLH